MNSMHTTGPSFVILLDLTTLIKFDEEYKLWSSSLGNLLHSHVFLFSPTYKYIPIHIHQQMHTIYIKS